MAQTSRLSAPLGRRLISLFKEQDTYRFAINHPESLRLKETMILTSYFVLSIHRRKLPAMSVTTGTTQHVVIAGTWLRVVLVFAMTLPMLVLYAIEHAWTAPRPGLAL